MRTLRFKGRELSVPESVDGLSPDVYRRYLAAVVLLNRGRISADTFREHLLSMLAGLRTDLRHYRLEYADELRSQQDCLSGFFDAAGNPIVGASRNLLPELDGWKGIGDMLNGLTFGEFCACLTALKDYREAIDSGSDEGAVEALETLARQMYRSENPDAPVPYLLLIHSAAFFSFVWNILLTQPVPINGELIDFRILFKSTGQNRMPDDHTGWQGVALEVAGSGVFGRLADVNATHFWDVLLYLYKCKFEALHTKTITTPKHK